MSDRRIVPIGEAARELGVGQSTVYRWLRLGLIQRYRQPFDRRRTYVDVHEVKELRDHPPFHEAR
jgi:excisionase family DNA binding protein